MNRTGDCQGRSEQFMVISENAGTSVGRIDGLEKGCLASSAARGGAMAGMGSAVAFASSSRQWSDPNFYK